jgi:ubiquinone/menaquinone biosynthesis C-methylase UbiE
MRERGEAKETFWLREYRAKASSGDALVASGRGARFGTAQYLQTVAHVVSTLRPAVTDRVLDVGCGNGLMAIVLARLCGEMIGVEPVVELAAQARDHNRAAANVGIVAGEARALPVRTESVDIVLCYGVLQLIEDADDVERMLAELARVLRCPGRALVGGIPDLRAKARVLEPYLAEVQAAAHLSAADKAAILERNRRGRWYDPDDLATAARGAGFAAVWRPAPAALVESEDRFDLLLERGAAR